MKLETVDLAFERFGDNSKPPLVILHGFFASSRNWRQIAEKLAVNWQVLVPDMRNHGASPHHQVLDYPAMAADILHFIEQKGLTSVNLLGHSMGGKVAMWFALNYPAYVRRLVVVDIAPVSYQHSFDPLIAALQALPLAAISNRKQAETQLAPAIPDLHYRQFLLQNLVLQDGAYRWRVDLDVFQKTAAHIIAFPDTQPLPPFSGKTLFVAGADSHYVNATQISTLFPNANLSIIANAGHWLHVQQPAAFMGQVEQFLQA